MRSPQYIKSLMMLSAMFTALLSNAQDAAKMIAPTGSAPDTSPTNYYMYLLVGVACFLLIAIAVLGQVLVRLTLYVYEHRDKLIKSVLLVFMLAISSHSILAQEIAAPATPAVESSHSVFSLDFAVAMTVVLTEVFVILVMLIRILSLLNIISPQPAAGKQMSFELPRWFDSLNKSVAIEHEKDVMLDHDYDGIRELDNQLPPWWKWGFVFTIIWAVCYFSYFHIFHAAPLSAGEYDNEIAEAKIAKDAYMKTVKNNVDENTIVFDASYITDGQKIFSENCVACHGDKGQGGVGPNLTDRYWLHGGKINDIFKTVKYGWPANGMKGWQADLSATQIAQVVCYVKTLKGTNPPNPKAPQGDLYSEDDKVAKDSTASASSAVKDTLSK